MPLLIFSARVTDVSLGTIRVVFISKGFKYLAPIVGFFEILIWLLAIGQIMKNLSSPACYIAYAAGFAMGNFVGILIIEKLSIGTVLLRVITAKDAADLVGSLSSCDYGVTSIDASGKNGNVKLIFTIVPRRQIKNAIAKVKKLNPNAFYSIEDIGFVEKGVFPPRKTWQSGGVKTFFKPFRKGK
jgi:uncharacterized protein YebE (UPF0316 family)